MIVILGSQVQILVEDVLFLSALIDIGKAMHLTLLLLSAIGE